MREIRVEDIAIINEVNAMRLKGKKPLPVGVDDFKNVIEEGYYYFDKTEMIEKLFFYKAKVTLFTRPRRFGKTLNMSMLKYFFDIEGREENRKLFDGLYISSTEYMEMQGQFPVIYVSFKSVDEEGWETCLRQTKHCISRLYNNYKFLEKTLTGKDFKDFTAIWMGEDEADWSSSLSDLSRYLSEYYGKKVVILIDEYDMPIISAYMNGYYKEAINFFKKLYGEALKGNRYLETGVMTGILRIAKEGIFSGLNNLKVDSIFENRYSKCYGFSEEEVVEALEYYEVSDKIGEVKEWYDGYLFGDSEVYNPWSIIRYLSEDKLDVYWIKSSGNALINEILKLSGRKIFDDLERLFIGETVQKTMRDYLEFTFSEDDIWELLTHSGYLTNAGKVGEEWEDDYLLRMPNREVGTFFKVIFIDRFLSGYSGFSRVIGLLRKGEIMRFKDELESEVLSSLSYFDTDRDEKYYRIFLIGISLILSGDYIVHSERESGHGRTDLVLEPRDRRNPGYIFEIKVAGSEKELGTAAEEALIQIGEKSYDMELRKRGIRKILKIGMAFYRKRLEMRYERVLCE